MWRIDRAMARLVHTIYRFVRENRNQTVNLNRFALGERRERKLTDYAFVGG